ncbi:putative RNA-directed DNA polymerase [Tanacetum coccineum]
MTGEKSSDSGKNDAIDVNSPYYIHPFDLPKQMHVNEALTDGNYSDWAKEMANFLFAKNKMGFVDETIPKPEKTAGSVKYANTSSEIWKDLKERFGKESAPRAYELKQSLSVTHQDGSSFSSYYTKLRSIWDEIQSVLRVPQCTCGKCSCNIGKRLNEFKEKERLYEFLMGLDGDFSTIRTHVLSIKPTPTLGEAYRLASEEEQQRQITMMKRTQVEPAAFKTQGRQEGSSNFQRNNKRVLKEPKRTTTEGIDNCTNCGKDGHKRDGCFELIGYPEWWPGKAKVDKEKRKAAYIETEPSLAGLTEAQYQVLMKHFTGSEGGPIRKANMDGKHDKNSDWNVDSGSTEHIVHNLESLENGTRTIREAPVMIPNGDNIPVEAKGDCTLIGGNKINEVLHVPNFNCNLLSVSRLSKVLQCVVSFFLDFCVMQGLHSKKLIGTGKCIQGLYRMGMVAQARKAMAIKVDAKICHSRLGHASDSKLSHIYCLKDISFDFKNNVCDSCVKAKHTRTPFPKSFIKTNECFELIHCDIWGKYRKPSTSHASLFLTIVDDFSRALWVFLIKHKSEASDASDCLISFHNMVKTQFSKPIKWIRSDNGGEFTSNRMKEFYAREGILLETTCPHTPKQNGVVERKHRHLLETARALMFQGSIPKRF